MEARLANGREARQIADSVKTLRLSGFAVADNSPALAIASLFNAGIFRQGGVLVGSHAFGALLNGLGIKLAANYCTDDIDIGTAAPVALAIPDDRSFLGVLRDMVVSTLRPAGLGANSRKDQQQALVMMDAVLEHNQAWVSEAIEALPLAARPRIAQAADQTLAYTEGFGDVTKDALEELSALRYAAREENGQDKDRKS